MKVSGYVRLRSWTHRATWNIKSLLETQLWETIVELKSTKMPFFYIIHRPRYDTAYKDEN